MNATQIDQTERRVAAPSRAGRDTWPQGSGTGQGPPAMVIPNPQAVPASERPTPIVAIPETTIDVAGYSCIGLRDNLEDFVRDVQIRYPAPSATQAFLLTVFDGAGGHAAGEIASGIAGASIASALTFYLTGGANPGMPCDLSAPALRQAIGEALAGANQSILDHAAMHPECCGMASTVVCALIISDKLLVAWAGDSRCYHYQAGTLVRLTRDHRKKVDFSVGDLLILPGTAAPQARQLVTRYLGQSNGFAPGHQEENISPGDIVLLCTDGITDVLSDEEIAARMDGCRAGHIRFRDLPATLAHDALDAGTTDNVSVLCAQCVPTAGIDARLMLPTRTDGYHAALAQQLQTLATEIST